MTRAWGSALPAWVVPSATEVAELYSLARSQYGAPRGNRPQARGIVGVLRWATGDDMVGPVTGRPDQPVTAAVAIAECWAAKSLTEGSISEEELKAACVELGVAYWPPDVELIDPEEGCGAYQTLSWLLQWHDGYRGGRVPPLPSPRHSRTGSTITPPCLEHLPQQRSTAQERCVPPSRTSTSD
ncbi:MAG: hypothetical protein JO296_18965 [Pseudonocardiales bacterium]|nr:hypothetical protein [Pseudonocardiales bacterium]